MPLIMAARRRQRHLGEMIRRVHSLLLPSLSARIRYVAVPGSSPALVYLHGLGSASAALVSTALHPALAALGRRVVLVDLVGSGWSDWTPAFDHTIEGHADAVAAVLDHLGIDHATVVGHSLGGSIAITLATRRPELVGRLVVAEPNLDPGVGQVSAHIAKQDESAFVSRGFSALLGALAREEAWDYRATMVRWDPVGLHRTSASLLADRSPTFREQLIRLDVPRTFLLGSRTSEDLIGLVESGVELVVIEDAGHAMMDDNPDAFATAVAAAAAVTVVA